MSTQLASLGPLCRTAIITFKPGVHFIEFTFYFLLGALVIKLVASLLKTYFYIEKDFDTTSTQAAKKRLTRKYNFPEAHLYILNSSKLIAFSSVLPGISNGIFLSKGLFKKLTPQQQEAVFLHELHHWKSKQTLSQLLVKLCADVFFFFPILKDLLKYWQLQSEIAADNFATAQLKSSKPLKEALLKWLDQKNTTPVWAVSFAETELSVRIRALNNTSSSKKNIQSKHYGITIKSLSVSLFVLVALLVLGLSKQSRAEATIIIPTNTQCSKLWRQPLNYSEANATMSPKLDI